MILLHPCTTCDKGLTERRNTRCLRCIAAFEAEFNPDDRPKTLPLEPPRLVRILRRLGGAA